MDVFISLIVVNISQYIDISKHVVYLKYMHFFSLKYTSVKLEKKKLQSEYKNLQVLTAMDFTVLGTLTKNKLLPSESKYKNIIRSALVEL